MADTKLSALTGVTTPALTDLYYIDQGGTSFSITGTQIQTLMFKNPTFAAGTTTAPSFTLPSGTLMTTAAAGAIEYDGTCFYASPAASTRNVILTDAFVCLASAYTLTSTTSAQKLFNSTTNGTLTLPVGTYFFDCALSISGMSSTTGNGQFQILGAGTATLGTVLYNVIGIDGATATAAAQTGSTSVTSNSPASMVTAGTSTALQAVITGTFRVTVAGTIIPSIALVTAAAAIVAAGSYFRVFAVGGSSVAAVGNWS